MRRKGKRKKKRQEREKVLMVKKGRRKWSSSNTKTIPPKERDGWCEDTPSSRPTVWGEVPTEPRPITDTE